MTRRWMTAAMCKGTVAMVITIAPLASQAIAPLLLVLIKEMAQQAATSMVKDMLLSSLSGMGCKGIALANAIQAYDLRASAGGPAGLLAGMPRMPAGMTMPSMPSMPNMAGGAGLGMGVAGMPMGAGMSPQMAAKFGQLMPGAGQLPPGMVPDADQMAMMARMQQAMAEPLSPPETLATIDELFELGFLPKSMQSELKECMLLVPATIPALGMGMGMLKPMLPQLRKARDELRALSPAEQDEVADVLLQQLKPLRAEERASLLEYLESGFFPPRVVQRVKLGATAG